MHYLINVHVTGYNSDYVTISLNGEESSFATAASEDGSGPEGTPATIYHSHLMYVPVDLSCGDDDSSTACGNYDILFKSSIGGWSNKSSNPRIDFDIVGIFTD